MLNWRARVASLLVLAWRHARGNGPEGHEDGDCGESGEESPCYQSTADLPREVARYECEEGEEEVIVERFAAGRIGWERRVLDRGILCICSQQSGFEYIYSTNVQQPTEVVRTP